MKVLEKLTSRKFLVALLVIVWWLVEGTINGTLAAFGWHIVALVLGYLVGEGARDALLAYWQGPRSLK